MFPSLHTLIAVCMLLWLAGCATTAPLPADRLPAESASPATTNNALPPGEADAPPALPNSPPGVAPTRLERTETLPLQTVASTPPPLLLDLTTPPDQLWQRIRNGFGMPDLHDPRVVSQQSWYLNRPDMLRRIFERGGRYLYHIVEELEKRGMPTELALLPMVESAFNPHAVSSARAMGLWQFIPSTGKNYDLDQNWWVDERRDIVASTDAALRYLQNVYDMHGDWHLALASYNWGEHAVARAIAKNQSKGLPTDYLGLQMPDETRYYVPKLQALKNIVAQPEVFGYRLPRLPNQPYFESVVKPERIDIAVAARLAEMPLEEFISLNPAYHRPVINGNQAGPLLLPTDKVDTFLANLARHAAEDKPLSNWQTYALKKGETLAKVAVRHQLSEAQLRRINGLPPRTPVKTGFNLLVPRPGSLANPTLMAKTLPDATPAKTDKVKTAPAIPSTRTIQTKTKATQSKAKTAQPKAKTKATQSKAQTRKKKTVKPASR